MAREIIGHIDCPHCGQAATVHQNGRGKALLYYRCGEVQGFASSGCGTVQIYGKTGQAWIHHNMRPLDAGAIASAPGQPEKPEPIASAPAPIRQPAPAPARKSVLGSLAQFLSEE